MTVFELIPAVLKPVEVYPGEAPKTAGSRFVVYMMNSNREKMALDGHTGLWTAVFDVNCVAGTYADVVSLAERVRSALSEMQGKSFDGLLVEQVNIQASPDLKEVDVGLWRRLYMLTLDYQIN